MTLIAEPLVDSRRGSLFPKEQMGPAIPIVDACYAPLFCAENRKPSFLYRRLPFDERPDYITESPLCLPEKCREIPRLQGDVATALAMAGCLRAKFFLKNRAVIFCGLHGPAPLFWCAFLLSLGASLSLWDRDLSLAERFAYSLYHQSGSAVSVVYRKSFHEGVPVLVHDEEIPPFPRNPTIPIHKNCLRFQWQERTFSAPVLEGVFLGQGWSLPNLERVDPGPVCDDFTRRLKENQIAICCERNLDNLVREKYNTYN